jgi:plasmid stabilization system protein ParE
VNRHLPVHQHPQQPGQKPFERHLLFYWDGSTLRVWRVKHSARDMPNRLLEDPEV